MEAEAKEMVGRQCDRAQPVSGDVEEAKEHFVNPAKIPEEWELKEINLK